MQIDWKLDWKFLFLSFQGRIGRIYFWIAFLLLVGAGVVVQLIPIVGQLIGFALLWPHLAIQAKRLHDIGRSAWLMAIPPAVTFVSVSLGAYIGGPTLIAALNRNDSGAIADLSRGLVVMLLSVAIPLLILAGFLLWIGLTRSQPRCNRYGPLPEVR